MSNVSSLNDLGAFDINTYDYGTGEELQDPIGWTWNPTISFTL